MDTLSTFIIEDNGGHDVLELELRKTFYLSKNVHCDMFGQSAKPRGILARILGTFWLVTEEAGLQTLNLNWAYWKSSRVNRCGGLCC